MANGPLQDTDHSMAHIYAFINPEQLEPNRSCEYCPLSLDLAPRRAGDIGDEGDDHQGLCPHQLPVLLSHLGLSSSISCKMQSQAFLAC